MLRSRARALLLMRQYVRTFLKSLATSLVTPYCCVLIQNPTARETVQDDLGMPGRASLGHLQMNRKCAATHY
jgi:hypothetical protein